MPVFRAEVSLVPNSAAINDNGKDDESSTAHDFNRAEDEFDFTIATDTEDLNNAEQEQKDGNPDADIEILSPERDGDTGSSEFEG